MVEEVDSITADEAALETTAEVGTTVLVADDEATTAETEEITEEAAAAPETAGILVSSLLTQPVFAVIAAGHSTCTKSTVGLSAPENQSKRQSQPGWRAVGKEEHVSVEIPPY